MGAVLQIDIDNGIFRRRRLGKTVARKRLRREDPRQSAADVFGTLDRVRDDRKSIHIQARDRNSINSTMPGLTNWTLNVRLAIAQSLGSQRLSNRGGC